MKQYEFLSSQWFEGVMNVFKQVVKDNENQLEGINYSVCEIFSEVPKSVMQGDNGTIAWFFHITDKGIDMGFGIYDAQYIVKADYELMKQLVVLEYDQDMPLEVQEKLSTEVDKGKVIIVGNKDNRPDFMKPVHNYIREITLPIL